jgi:hypothetical protein
MTIYGWGTSFKDFEVPNTNQYITTTYNYFHIWWLLRLTFNRRFFLNKATQNENGEVTITTKPITKDEIKTLLGTDIIKPWWFIFNQSLSFVLIPLLILTVISIAIPRESKPLATINTLSSTVIANGEQISLKDQLNQEEKNRIRSEEINKKNEEYITKFKQNIIDKKFELSNKEKLYTDNKQQFLSCIGKAEISETSFSKYIEGAIKPEHFTYNPNQLIQENLNNEVGLSFAINNKKCSAFIEIDKNTTDKVKINSITLKLK